MLVLVLLFQFGIFAVFNIKLREVPDIFAPTKSFGVEGFGIELVDGAWLAIIRLATFTNTYK